MCCGQGQAAQWLFLTIISGLLSTSPHPLSLSSLGAKFNSHDWRMSPVHPDMFLERRFSARRKKQLPSYLHFLSAPQHSALIPG